MERSEAAIRIVCASAVRLGPGGLRIATRTNQVCWNDPCTYLVSIVTVSSKFLSLIIAQCAGHRAIGTGGRSPGKHANFIERNGQRRDGRRRSDDTEGLGREMFDSSFGCKTIPLHFEVWEASCRMHNESRGTTTPTTTGRQTIQVPNEFDLRTSYAFRSASHANSPESPLHCCTTSSPSHNSTASISVILVTSDRLPPDLAPTALASPSTVTPSTGVVLRLSRRSCAAAYHNASFGISTSLARITSRSSMGARYSCLVLASVSMCSLRVCRMVPRSTAQRLETCRAVLPMCVFCCHTIPRGLVVSRAP